MIEVVRTLLDAATATGASDKIGPSFPTQSYQISLSATTTPSATVLIQGSNDGTNWITEATHSPSGSGDSVGGTLVMGWAFMRANCTAIAGTSATVTVTCAY